MTKLKFMAVFIVFILMAIWGHSLSMAYNVTTTDTDGTIFANPNDLEIPIPLSIDTTEGLESFSLIVSFDPNILESLNDLYKLTDEYAPPGTENSFLYAGLLDNARVAISAMNMGAPSLSNVEFLKIYFKVKPDIDPNDTEIKIEGVIDPENQLEDVNLTVKIRFGGFSIPIQVKGVENFDKLEVHLLDVNGNCLQVKDNITDGSTDYFTVEKEGTYQIKVVAPGYKQIDELNQFPVAADLPLKIITMQLLQVMIDLDWDITEDSKLKLDFAYWVGGFYIDWPYDKLLQLKFFENGNTNTPTGVTIAFTPTSQNLADPNDLTATFDVKYISQEIDPGIYKKEVNVVDGVNVYTVSFRAIVSDINAPYATRAQFDREFTVRADQTESDYIIQYQSSPPRPADDLASIKDFSAKGKLTLFSGTVKETVKEVEIKLTLPDNLSSFLKDPNNNTVAENQLLELRVESKPLEPGSNITLVNIDFIDSNGKCYEYNPAKNPAAKPITFYLPLHDDLQEGGLLNPLDAPLSQTEIRDYLDTEYAVYFESQYTGGVPTKFVPDGGESLSVYQIDQEGGLWYAVIKVKHSSTWYVNLVPVQPPTQPEKEEGDHWYECFIKTIRPGFLFK